MLFFLGGTSYYVYVFCDHFAVIIDSSLHADRFVQRVDNAWLYRHLHAPYFLARLLTVRQLLINTSHNCVATSVQTQSVVSMLCVAPQDQIYISVCSQCGGKVRVIACIKDPNVINIHFCNIFFRLSV